MVRLVRHYVPRTLSLVGMVATLSRCGTSRINLDRDTTSRVTFFNGGFWDIIKYRSGLASSWATLTSLQTVRSVSWPASAR